MWPQPRKWPACTTIYSPRITEAAITAVTGGCNGVKPGKIPTDLGYRVPMDRLAQSKEAYQSKYRSIG